MSRIHPSLLTVVLVVFLAVPFAAARELVYHSGGKVYPLERSATEHVVTIDGVIEETRARLAAIPHCTVEDIPGSHGASRLCIVRADQPDPAAQARVGTVPGVGAVHPVYRVVGSEGLLLSTGNLVVRLAADLTAADRTEFFNNYRVTLVNELDPENNVYTVRPMGHPTDGDIVSSAAMFSDDRTVFAHPDFIAPTELRQILSQFEDEFFTQQWHLNNTGQGGGTLGADINIEDAWRITFGEDVTVGIFDDSVDVGHVDLLPNYTGVGQDPALGTESSVAPNPRGILDFHGTSVVGLAVADANDFGVVGVAPASKFTASRGLNEASLGQVASAFVFARQQNVMVHINSWGFVDTPNSQADVVVSAIRASFENGRDERGMVIVFASGNNAEELGPDDDLSVLPEVIGVGASNADDKLASYSNFGTEIDVLAPSADSFLPGLLTTDNTDDSGFINPGFNDGGTFNESFGPPIPDLPDPDFTQHFSGTSGSCPIVAGLAALIVSANQNLTASQVRTIIEQTADPIDAAAAEYHPVTERSLTHGYGRINAGAAVQAAAESRDNGDFTWPDRLRSVRINGDVLIWTVGDDIREVDDDNNPDTPPLEFGEVTNQTLVVESLSPFGVGNSFIPSDGVTYSLGESVASGITVVHNDDRTAFTLPSSSGTRYYALFPSNAIGRYGFGVTIDTNGNVNGIGVSAGDDGAGTDQPPSISAPRPSIVVSPLSGESPLEVEFRGNALSDNAIESFLWDFDDGETSTRATTTHRYVVTGNESRRFFPTFTVTDEFGNVGTRSVAVDVTGEAGSGETLGGNIRIVVSLPGAVGSDVDSGVSPLSVELHIAGVPAGTIQSVRWDLGDGSEASTLAVPHTYVNESTMSRTLPITVDVETLSDAGVMTMQSDTRFITIAPNPTPGVDPGTTDPTGDGTTVGNAVIGGGTDEGSSGQPVPTDLCGAGSLVAIFSLVGLSLVRRRYH